MKRNVYVSAAASVVLLVGTPITAAAAASADTARTAATAATAARVDVDATGAVEAALKHYPGVVESLDKDGSTWRVDVVSKDGRGHAEVEVTGGGEAATREEDTARNGSENKALLDAKVTAAEAIKAALAARPGTVSSVDWEDVDDSHRAPHWHVEVKTVDGTTQDLSVDALTGKATVAPADSDRDDNDGRDNG